MKLEKEIRKNGVDYELVERSDKVAIYKHINKTFSHVKTISFEVFLIESEKFPKHKDLGKTLWTYSTFEETLTREALKKAYTKYNYLNTQII